MNALTPPTDFPFVITPLREEDIPAVMAIERRVFTLPWTAGIYRYELRHNRYGRYLAVRAQDERLPPVVAYGGVWLYLPEAHISTLAVHPDFRGLHMGAWLLAALLLAGAREGAEEGTLEVRVSNRAAQRLYLSFGFRVVGRRLRYYSDNREDAYIMTLRPLDADALQRRFAQEERTVRERWRARGEAILQALAASDQEAGEG